MKHLFEDFFEKMKLKNKLKLKKKKKKTKKTEKERSTANNKIDELNFKRDISNDIFKFNR